MKGVPLFISALIHLGGGAFFGLELIQPAQFRSALPAPSLAVNLVAPAPAPAVAVLPVAPPPEIRKPEILPEPKKIAAPKRELPKQQPVQASPSASLVPPQRVVSDSVGTVENSTMIKASPDYLRNPPPLYPIESRRRKEEGVVLLSVVISEKGLPTIVKIKESSNWERLDNEALRAVSSWSFKPATLAGVAIVSQVDVPVRFSLRRP